MFHFSSNAPIPRYRNFEIHYRIAMDAMHKNDKRILQCQQENIFFQGVEDGVCISKC